ncbi:MAG: HYR domain-containing protein [Actinobacteria bacterium]|nr:HYR domain-containing protein [Actinomycetota bacterium]
MNAVPVSARAWSLRRMAALLAVVVLTSLLVPGTASASSLEQLDQEASPSSNGWYTVIDPSYNQAVFQTFTAGTTGSLTRADAYLLGDAGAGDVTVEIIELDAHGLPTGTVIGSGSAPATLSAWSPGWAEVALNQPAPVIAGTTYAVGVSGPGYRWMYANSYAGGNGIVRDQYGTWMQQSSADYAFRTYVTPPSLINGSFEDGLNAWVVANGTVANATSYASLGPVDGASFAVLHAGAVNVYTTLSQEVWVPAGATLCGSAFFKANDYLPYNDDGAVVTIEGGSSTTTLFSASVSTVGDYGATPWTPFGFSFPASGSYTIEARVRNVSDSGFSSALGIDHLRISTGSCNAPHVSVTGVAHGATYEFGTVPVAQCQISDVEDGTLSELAALSPITGPNAASGLGAQTASCSYTDSDGLSASASVTYTISDTAAPDVSVPPDVVAEATGPDGAVVTYPPATALDAVEGAITPSCAPAAGQLFTLGTTTVTCTATDASGNTGTGSFTVTVLDTAGPVLDLPAGMVVEATSASGAMVTFDVADATDVVDGAVATVCNPGPGSQLPLGTTQIGCTATDASGNISTGSFAITVQDSTAPVVAVPANLIIEATGPTGATTTWSGVSADDAVDGSLPVVCDPASGSTFPLGMHAVSCSAVDAAGNEGSNSFWIEVQDTTAPVLEPPIDLTVEATSSLGANVAFDAPTATDQVDGTVTPLCDWTSGETFSLGTTTVTCSATDAAGNSASVSFQVTVHDTTAPEFDAPSDVVTEAASAGGATVAYPGSSATDLVDGTVAVVCDPGSGATYPLGTTTVTCSAADAAGNLATRSFTVTVQDTTPPQVLVPANIVAAAIDASGAPVSYTGASATDTVSGVVPVSCTPEAGATFPLGTTTVVCSSTDGAGNAGSASFTVTVQDETAPVVTVPADVVTEATGPDGATVTYDPATAEDNVDGQLSATCDPASGTVYPLGDTAVGCTATDAAGNTGMGGFTVTVRDTTAPEVTVSGNLTVTATSSAGATVSYDSAAALDLVDGVLTPACTSASGTTFPLGVTTVTCSATDAAGNTGSKSFTVTVAYSWSGVLSPLSTDTTPVFRLGRVVPVKFELTGASAGITDATAKLLVTKIGDSTTADEEAAVSVSSADAGNTFRYDPIEEQYVFNLSTKQLNEGTWRLRIDLGDGTTNSVLISLRG